MYMERAITKSMEKDGTYTDVCITIPCRVIPRSHLAEYCFDCLR